MRPQPQSIIEALGELILASRLDEAVFKNPPKMERAGKVLVRAMASNVLRPIMEAIKQEEDEREGKILKALDTEVKLADMNFEDLKRDIEQHKKSPLGMLDFYSFADRNSLEEVIYDMLNGEPQRRMRRVNIAVYYPSEDDIEAIKTSPSYREGSEKLIAVGYKWSEKTPWDSFSDGVEDVFGVDVVDALSRYGESLDSPQVLKEAETFRDNVKSTSKFMKKEVEYDLSKGVALDQLSTKTKSFMTKVSTKPSSEGVYGYDQSFIPINLSGWYTTEEEEEAIRAKHRESTKYGDKGLRLWVMAVTPDAKKRMVKDKSAPSGFARSGGYFESGNPSVTVFVEVPESLDSMSKSWLERELNSAEDILEHELRHWGQIALSWVRIDKKPEDERRRLTGGPKKKLVRGKSLSDRSVPHRLRGEEFHTRLGDTLKSLKRLLKTHKRLDPKEAFRVFTGAKIIRGYRDPLAIIDSDSWLDDLKDEAPDMWREAVKKLKAELNRAGYRI